MKINLKVARAVKGITQWKLAMLTGIQQATLSHIERGELETTQTHKEKIAKALNMPIKDIVFNNAKAENISSD